MKVAKGKVRTPEIGRPWLNSPPSYFRQLRGRARCSWFPTGAPSHP